jgi:hypothetical protein
MANFFTDNELLEAKGGCLVFDIESFPNYFLIVCKCFHTGRLVTFERYEGVDFNIQKLLFVLHNFTCVGFNSNSYDMPMAWASLKGFTAEVLNRITRDIIIGEERPRDIEKSYGFKVGNTKHVDLIEVAPLKASLKLYAGRLHAPLLRDLPFAPTKKLTLEEMKEVFDYCINDVDNTALLLANLIKQLDLRQTLGAEYNIDLLSKSDAQIAEHVLSSEIAKHIGREVKRPTIAPGTIFKYDPPAFLSFKTEVLKDAFEKCKSAIFEIPREGKLLLPLELTGEIVKTKRKGIKVNVGNSTYQIGLGGLHSCEKSISHEADGDTILTEKDVTSYYPFIILNNKYFPLHIGEAFLDSYGDVVRQRLKAKQLNKQSKCEKESLRNRLNELGKNGIKKEYLRLESIIDLNTTISDSLKITINGSFGKFGSKWSKLYSPHLMIQVTLTGQLSLLMLIEMIESQGIPVVSGNTDGIVIKCPKSRYRDLEMICLKWESLTAFNLEETRYSALYSRDVNNYLAIKEKGGHKGKGAFSFPDLDAGKFNLSKNPVNQICVEAVLAHIKTGKPLLEFIQASKDVRKFVTVRNVKGGAVKNGEYLGKAIRWYYKFGEMGTINYQNTGNKVPKSDGAKPLMILPSELPKDIDYKRYETEAEDILNDIGFYEKAKQLNLF